jgi:transposase
MGTAGSAGSRSTKTTEAGTPAVRATTLLNRLLRYRSVSAVGVAFPPGPPTGPSTGRPDGRAEVVQVEVRLRRRWLYCPACSYRTRARYDTRPVLSHWRALDWGSYQVRILARLRRLACPAHGVLTEAVPFARHGAGFTRDFEALTAVLATSVSEILCNVLCGLTGGASWGYGRGRRCRRRRGLVSSLGW